MTVSPAAQLTTALGGSHPDEPSPAQVAAAVTPFAMLADPTRVQILWALRHGELEVATLAAEPAAPRLLLVSVCPNCGWPAWVDGTRAGRRVM